MEITLYIDRGRIDHGGGIIITGHCIPSWVGGNTVQKYIVKKLNPSSMNY